PSRKSAYALPVKRVLKAYVPRIGLPDEFGWNRLSNQLTSSTPNFMVCRPWIQLRLSANWAWPSLTGLSRLMLLAVIPEMLKYGWLLVTPRFGKPWMPIWSSIACPFNSPLLCETRITTPARNSLMTLGRRVAISPRVQKFTRRILLDVPTVVGGRAERAP